MTIDYMCIILQNSTTKHHWPRGNPPTGCEFPNMPKSLNNHTSILSFNYLNMHQVLCACACATSRLECKICKEAYQPCAQLASMKKQSLWYVRPKIPMESHTVCHGCKHGGIKTLLVRTVKSKMHNLTSSYSSKSGPRVPSASWMWVSPQPGLPRPPICWGSCALRRGVTKIS